MTDVNILFHDNKQNRIVVHFNVQIPFLLISFKTEKMKKKEIFQTEEAAELISSYREFSFQALEKEKTNQTFKQKNDQLCSSLETFFG